MNTALCDLIGQRVRIWSGQGLADEGVLEAFDHPWLRLRNPAGEILCFSVYLIRLVKPLEPPEGDEHLVAV